MVERLMVKGKRLAGISLRQSAFAKATDDRGYGRQALAHLEGRLKFGRLPSSDDLY
jgi:hypothetical protein